MATFRVTITSTNPTAAEIRSNLGRHANVKQLIRFFRGLLVGACTGTLGISADASATGAAGTVTAASVSANDTVVVGNQTFTAKDKSEKSPFTCVANTSSALNGLYFDVYEGSGAGTPVRIWFSTASVGEAPATPTGGRLLNVDLVDNDADTAVATAIGAALADDAGLYATVSTNVVTVKNRTAGNTTNASAGTSGFTLGSITAGAALSTDEFNMSTENADTAASLVAAINANATASLYVLATSAAAVVTVTAIGKALGVIGNLLKLTSSNGTRLAVSVMASGAEDASAVSHTW